MAEVSKIEEELLAVTKLPEKKKEDRQKYLYRLMYAAAKVKDDVWESISPIAQDWVNGGAEAHKAGDEIEDFPDYEEDEPDTNPRPEEVDEEVDEEAAPVVVKKKEPKKTEPKEEKEEKPVKAAKEPEKQVRRVSACHMIKKLIVQTPKITVDELSKQLKDMNLKASDITVATLRSDMRDTLRLFNELGMGKEKFELS